MLGKGLRPAAPCALCTAKYTARVLSLVALLTPALALPLLLWLAPGAWALPDPASPSSWPASFWVMALAGTTATLAGLLDWRFHRNGGRRIAAAERRAELIALALGLPLFVLLALTSGPVPLRTLLVPIVAVALAMTALIVFDEVRFHRACGRYETLLHRFLVGGNGIAFLAWLAWCAGREVGHG
jgi:hypothetical protein